MKKYKHLIFDLDKTLWDFDTNSKETLLELYIHYNLRDLGVKDFQSFYQTYEIYNLKYWKLYRENLMAKEELKVKRFDSTLMEFEIYNYNLASEMSVLYLDILPTKTAMFEGVAEVLKLLAGKYSMHILTNGFQEVQGKKLKNSNLIDFFKNIITSEEIGLQKPAPALFEHALKRMGASANDCLMIGDDIEADIIGAAHAGIDQVFFNPEQKSVNFRYYTYEISNFKQLADLLG